MPTLEHNNIVFRFPEIDEEASFSIDFQRTLRIPDTERDYFLPPGLGRFPIRHVEDYQEHLPASTVARGGVLFPMWQAEAMWLNFSSHSGFPVAVKVAAGKVNAVSGEPWSAGLNQDPQDYMVCPNQPWLDGFAVEPGIVRQFVAMPLGEGYSAEEQLTGGAEWGGLQIGVTPMKRTVWEALKGERAYVEFTDVLCSPAATEMGLGAGGGMHQSIEPDRYGPEAWDPEFTQRVFVTLVHAKDWKTLTGEVAPNRPPTAQEYAQAGLPWFAWYGVDQPLPGGKTLAGVKSVGGLHKEKTGAELPHSKDVDTGEPITLGAGNKPAGLIKKGDWE